MTDDLRPPMVTEWPIPGAPAGLNWRTWDRPPQNRWSFQHVAELLPTAVISRGDGPVRELPPAPQELGAIAFEDVDGSTSTVDDMLETTWTDGFLVLHEGRVVAETYRNGMTAATLHLSQSVAKSLTSALVGILVGRGEIDVRRTVDHYIPELTESGYAGATVDQVLDMRSGVRFREEYWALDSEVAALDRACGWKPLDGPDDPAPTIRTFIPTLQLGRPHGGPFVYRSIETDVLAWVLEAVSKQDLATLMSAELWGPMDAEADANVTIDREGTGLADGGVNATLRDYGRFGQLFLDGGANGERQVVPEAWTRACRTGDVEAFRPYYGPLFPDFPHAAYSRQFWVLDTTTGRHTAVGIHGQLVHVDPAHGVVVAKLSSWPDPLDEPLRLRTYRAVEAIGRELAGA